MADHGHAHGAEACDDSSSHGHSHAAHGHSHAAHGHSHGGGGGGEDHGHAHGVAGLEALLGAALVTQAGQEVATAEALAGAEHVLLYCSAHWCPPCRAFTPELTAWVNKHGARLRLKLVFASSDRDEAAFSGYFKGMAAGALALPFGDDKADELMRKFKVSGIPTLLVLDASGHLLTKQGREGVSSDAEGAHFPWAGAGAAGADESGGGGGCTVA